MQGREDELTKAKADYAGLYEKYKELQKVAENQHAKLEEAEKKESSLQTDITKLSIRSAAMFDELTPRYSDLKAAAQEFGFPANAQRSTIEFTKKLVESFRAAKSKLAVKKSKKKGAKESAKESAANLLNVAGNNNGIPIPKPTTTTMS